MSHNCYIVYCTSLHYPPMSQVCLTPEEQKKIVEVKFANNLRDGDVTAQALLATLKSNDPGSRVAFLNYYIGKATGGKQPACIIKSDPYNQEIVPNLSKKAEAMHKNTISGTGSTGFDILAKAHQNGMFTTPLLNVGTSDKPVWDIFPNIVATVVANGFSVRNVFNQPDPKRVVVNIKNNEKHNALFSKFLSPGAETIDNLAYCEIVKIVQEELRDCLGYIKELYDSKEHGKTKIHFRADTGISSTIFEPNRLDETSAAALYKTVKSVAKKTGGTIEFEQIPCESPEDHYTQLRIGISQQTDDAFWNDYHKGSKHGFTEKNVRIVAPKHQVYYRYCNTKLLGKNTNSIINIPVMLSLKHSDKYGTAPENPGMHTVYAYRYSDKKLAGEDYQALFEFPECNTQVLNTVVNLKIFVGPHDFTPSFDIVAGRPLFVVRLDNSNFKRDDGPVFEDIADISYEAGAIASVATTASVAVAPKVTATEEDLSYSTGLPGGEDDDGELSEEEVAPTKRRVAARGRGE